MNHWIWAHNICKEIISICAHTLCLFMVIILTVNFFFFLYEDHGCGSRISLPPGFSCLKILLKNRLRPSSPQLKWIHLVTLSARITSYSSFCMSNNSSHSSTKFPCKKFEEVQYPTQTDDETNYMYKA